MALVAALLSPASESEGEASRVLEDPRPELVRARQAGDLEGALETLAAARATGAEPGGSTGRDSLETDLEYLRARLLLESGPRPEGLRVLAGIAGSLSTLAPFARLRLAEEYLAEGEPASAAEQAVAFLDTRRPGNRRTGTLEGRAVSVLEEALATGGDCSLVAGSEPRLSERDARRWRLAQARCAGVDEGVAGGTGTAGETGAPQADSTRLLEELLEADTTDDVAFRAAAELAARLDPKAVSAETLLLVGLAFYEHREFEAASRWLGQALVRLPATEGITPRQIHECRYALGRSYFWLEGYGSAIKAYTALAADTEDPTDRARVLYQRARSFELSGREHWPAALAAFAEVEAADPRGRYSSAAKIARLRLAWLLGSDSVALDALEALSRRRNPSDTSRALLFLAATELERWAAPSEPALGIEPPPPVGPEQKAGLGTIASWLAEADSLGRLEDRELAYWKARLAEEVVRRRDAAELYLEVLADDPYHPFAAAARQRLESEELRPVAVEVARERSTSDDRRHLHGAWLLLGEAESAGQRARQRLREKLAEDSRAAAFLGLGTVPVESWPLWRSRLVRPEERLLGLGLFDDGGSQVMRHFPVSEPSLAFTGSQLLSRAGATRRALYLAEVLRKRVPRTLPEDLLPAEYRQLLHPFGYSFLVLRESNRRHIDPFLLAAIIREESRYDPAAFSRASARGLTQFVYPTAKEIAASIELGPIEARDIHRPEIAVALGAAYLRQLADRLDGRVETVVAAYNAGEPQARLWRQYCAGPDQPEYLSKIAFRETRHYARRVLGSRARYTELYGRASDATSAANAGPAEGVSPAEPSSADPAPRGPSGGG